MKNEQQQAEIIGENKTEIIIKSEYHFTPITTQITQSNKLSDFAVRLYCYLKSHNKNFYLSYRTIEKYLKIGREKLYKGLKELKQSGFLIIEKEPNTNRYIYKLLEEPTNKEYLINNYLDNNDLTIFNRDDIKSIYALLNDKHITKETKQKLLDKLNRIIKTEWINK